MHNNNNNKYPAGYGYTQPMVIHQAKTYKEEKMEEMPWTLNKKGEELGKAIKVGGLYFLTETLVGYKRDIVAEREEKRAQQKKELEQGFKRMHAGTNISTSVIVHKTAQPGPSGSVLNAVKKSANSTFGDLCVLFPGTVITVLDNNQDEMVAKLLVMSPSIGESTFTYFLNNSNAAGNGVVSKEEFAKLELTFESYFLWCDYKDGLAGFFGMATGLEKNKEKSIGLHPMETEEDLEKREKIIEDQLKWNSDQDMLDKTWKQQYQGIPAVSPGYIQPSWVYNPYTPTVQAPKITTWGNKVGDVSRQLLPGEGIVLTGDNSNVTISIDPSYNNKVNQIDSENIEYLGKTYKLTKNP